MCDNHIFMVTKSFWWSNHGGANLWLLCPTFSGFFRYLVLWFDDKMPPIQEVHRLNYWSSASDVILEDSGDFRHWGITDPSGHAPGGYPWSSAPSFLFASCLPWGRSLLLHKLLLPRYSAWPQSHTTMG